jgi:uncharacterized protein YkwD
VQRIPTLVVFAIVVAFGCGGTRQRTRLGRELTVHEIAAPAPSVSHYTTAVPEGPAVTGGGDVAAVRTGVEAAARARSVSLTADPRLATLAEWIAEYLGPAGDPPPSEVIDFFAWNLGLVEPTPHVMVLGLPDRASIAEHVEGSTAQFLERQRYTHWGGTMLPRSGVWLIVVVLSWRHLELDPMPRRVEPGMPIRVRGRLASGFHDPTIVVQEADGQVRRIPAGAGPEFEVRLPTHTRGTLRVEVLARGPHGESVLANAPIYAGEDPPRSVRLEPGDESGARADVATIHRQLLERLNRTRAEVGLPPLQPDERLDAIALAHSEDMRAHDFVGHVSPTTGSAADRVRNAGIRTGLVLENIGRGYTADEIHRGLLDSPGHRANLINPNVTHVGIGVVGEEENGQMAFLVTELFIHIPEPIDTARAPGQVLERLNRARAARGAPAMIADPNLTRAAQEAADAFFANPSMSQQEAIDQASASLRRFAIQYRRIGGVMAVVGSIDEATQLEPALDESVQRCGVGVAQGTRPDTAPNAIAVVIMLGWER